MKTTPPAKSGFTLLEIMLATLVVTIGLFSVAALFGVGITSSRKAEEDLEAVALADLLFGHLQTTNWSHITGPVVLTGYDGETLHIIPDQNQLYTNLYTGAILGYCLQLQSAPLIKEISLQIWPHHSADQPQHFYTEVYDWKRSGP
jgi:Tfp pilus assembly protein PilV